MNDLSPSVTKRVLQWMMLAAVIIGIFYLCAFKILDQDFWWHVKAGEIMMKTHDIIRMEPFSYTLEGQAYHSAHQWLSEIIFALIYDAGGIPATIIFRTLVILATFLVVLAVDWKRLWPNGLLVILAAYSSRPSFLDRAQILTYFFFATSCWMALRYLRERKNVRFYVIPALIIQLLWVNMHGAAAIMSIAIAGAVLCQILWEWLTTDGEAHQRTGREAMHFGLLILGLLILMRVTPNGWQPFMDLYVYSTDKTLPLIREWMPMLLKDYLTAIAPFGVLAILCLMRVRRDKIATGLLVTVFGVLSIQSFRHCVLFLILSLAVIFYQLKHWSGWEAWWERRLSQSRLAIGISFVVLLCAFSLIYYRDGRELRQMGYFGYGAVTPVARAYDFVEQQQIKGRMFNTYNQGTYLLARGYPDRKVFFDGRNLEYGYTFMNNVIEAGGNATKWKELSDKYQFTYAIVDFKGRPEDQFLPYILHFEADPHWVLVYMDDTSAVYLKDLPENKTTIKKFAYKLLTPSLIEFDRVLDRVTQKNVKQYESELRRMADGDPEGIKSRLILGRLYVNARALDAAQIVANELYAIRPSLPEVNELLGLIAAGRGDWAEAGAFFERAVSLSAGGEMPINYAFLAEVFSRAGDVSKAASYAEKAALQQKLLRPPAAPAFSR